VTHTTTRSLLRAMLGVGLAVAGSWQARADIVQNGSLEDLNSNWTNDSGGFKALYANSTAIAGWTVGASVTNEIAWGYGQDSFYPAADGSYYVDLTGFGSDRVGGPAPPLMPAPGWAGGCRPGPAAVRSRSVLPRARVRDS